MSGPLKTRAAAAAGVDIDAGGAMGTNLGATLSYSFAAQKRIVMRAGTLNANLAITLTNAVAGCTFLFDGVQDGTGGRTVTLVAAGDTQAIEVPDGAAEGVSFAVHFYSPTDVRYIVPGGGTSTPADQSNEVYRLMLAGDQAPATNALPPLRLFEPRALLQAVLDIGGDPPAEDPLTVVIYASGRVAGRLQVPAGDLVVTVTPDDAVRLPEGLVRFAVETVGTGPTGSDIAVSLVTDANEAGELAPELFVGAPFDDLSEAFAPKMGTATGSTIVTIPAPKQVRFATATGQSPITLLPVSDLVLPLTTGDQEIAGDINLSGHQLDDGFPAVVLRLAARTGDPTAVACVVLAWQYASGFDAFNVHLRDSLYVASTNGQVTTHPTGTTWVTFRFQVLDISGTQTMRAKSWIRGQSEPGSWQKSIAAPNGVSAGTAALAVAYGGDTATSLFENLKVIAL